MAENNTTRTSFASSVREHALQLSDLVSELQKNGTNASVIIIATCDDESGEGHRTTMGVFGIEKNIINGLIDFAEQDEESKHVFNEAFSMVTRRRLKGHGIDLESIIKEVAAEIEAEEAQEQENDNTNKQED